MNLSMPKKDKDAPPTEVKESKVLNLIADKDDILWYYPGTTVAGLKKVDYSPEGIRDVILKKQKEVKTQHGLDEKGDSHKDDRRCQL